MRSIQVGRGGRSRDARVTVLLRQLLNGSDVRVSANGSRAPTGRGANDCAARSDLVGDGGEGVIDLFDQVDRTVRTQFRYIARLRPCTTYEDPISQRSHRR
jgi:hypothetical protein